jgi:hypothetical protein
MSGQGATGIELAAMTQALAACGPEGLEVWGAGAWRWAINTGT